MAELHPTHPSLDNSLGAAFIGLIASAMQVEDVFAVCAMRC